MSLYDAWRAFSLTIRRPIVSTPPAPWISIRSADLSAKIDPLGAQLSTLQDRTGADLLWNGDVSVWAGRAPLLFPIVGELAGGIYRLGPTIHRLPRHGFARRSVFQVEGSSSDSVVFRLQADELTLERYPFRFELEMHFEVNGPTLTQTAFLRNLGETPMPASIGYHPAFRWPLPYGAARSAHFIEFPHDEPAPVRRLDADGLLTPERHATPVIQHCLVLADDLFRDDALIFDDLRSRYVTYGAIGTPRIRVSFADAPYLGMWNKPGAGFICIEPWHGIADPQGYAGDFRDKPGIFIVEPGAVRSIGMAITLLPA
jgi:galactose mutarotase-like enzyme